MNIVRLLASAVLGYLLGNIQTGLIVGWTTKKIDLRQHGSGSSGATNALRILGRQSALWTLLGDFLKGLLAACLGLLIGGWRGGLLAGMCVVAGHIWPVFFGFKGGKGVATSLGVLTPLVPLQALLVAVTGITLILTTRIVSLSNMLAACLFLVTGSVTAIVRSDWLLLAFSVLLPAMIVFAHRANIHRILAGTESRISASMFHKKK